MDLLAPGAGNGLAGVHTLITTSTGETLVGIGAPVTVWQEDHDSVLRVIPIGAPATYLAADDIAEVSFRWGLMEVCV